MLTQQQLIETARIAIARREGKPEVTYYRVGKLMGMTPAYMQQLAAGGGRIMSAEMAFKMAALAELDPGYVMACIEAERAERDHLETTGTWRVIAAQLAGKAAGIMLAVTMAALMAHGQPVIAGTFALANDSVRTVDLYIMRSSGAVQQTINRLRGIGAWFKGFFRLVQKTDAGRVPVWAA